ncbi:hypothetical protein [Sphingomonas sp. CARO-RG-8B-R24-01]|uniref:hypothetical protein n=1 Tax=Sphingomonas sp. CARO-RG-8B-R24-01 TaxID=2914831 RepID=UPI001F5ACAD0|nr:hypothetical protein [Sphingomonas sp. CARO-RG-8B-R24-01]
MEAPRTAGSSENLTFLIGCPNGCFVPKYAISAPLQGDREPMNECPKLEAQEGALSVHDWVF